MTFLKKSTTLQFSANTKKSPQTPPKSNESVKKPGITSIKHIPVILS